MFDESLLRLLTLGVYALGWGLAALFLSTLAFWLYELWLARGYEPPPVVHGPGAVGVRILTIDAAEVVQETVDSLPPEIPGERVRVIAEEPIEVEGAVVDVVPEDFECDAVAKGRALEWARRNVPCEREYVLFLDEDTHVTGFDGLPDADVVQFRERPVYTGSLLAYWAEILRMGYQVEQLAFPRLDIPPYAWGGGIAIRREVEDTVGWDYPSIVEDTAFVWRAAHYLDASFAVMDRKWHNQAPPSIGAMFRQRRRWLAGTVNEERFLPLEWHGLLVLRNTAWVVSPGAPFVVWAFLFLPAHIPLRFEYTMLAWLSLSFTGVWLVFGFAYYEWPSPRHLLLVPIEPLVLALHAAGATLGLFSRPDEFAATEKADHTLGPGTGDDAEGTPEEPVNRARDRTD